MKIIKRALSQLSAVTGAIVDTFNVANKTTNAPSVRAIEEKLNSKANNNHTHDYYKLKNDFVVLSGDISMNDGEGAVNISYPDGFNKNNCVILTANIANSNYPNEPYSFGIVPDQLGLMSGAIYHRVTFTNVIGLKIKNYTDGGNYMFKYKIVLMKV